MKIEVNMKRHMVRNHNVAMILELGLGSSAVCKWQLTV